MRADENKNKIQYKFDSSKQNVRYTVLKTNNLVHIKQAMSNKGNIRQTHGAKNKCDSPPWETCPE